MTIVKIITEIDLDETFTDYDDIEQDRYFLDGDDVYEQWLVRPGKTDSQLIGKLYKPLPKDEIEDSTKAKKSNHLTYEEAIEAFFQNKEIYIKFPWREEDSCVTDGWYGGGLCLYLDLAERRGYPMYARGVRQPEPKPVNKSLLDKILGR